MENLEIAEGKLSPFAMVKAAMEEKSPELALRIFNRKTKEAKGFMSVANSYASNNYRTNAEKASQLWSGKDKSIGYLGNPQSRIGLYMAFETDGTREANLIRSRHLSGGVVRSYRPTYSHL